MLQPVTVPKPAAMLAEMLREKILRGEFPEGETLPTERELVEQTRLTRAAVREALGVLKQQGLVTTRPGRHGGTVVTRPSVTDLRSSLEVYIQSQGWNAQTPVLQEIREIVEPWCAGLAAARHTEEDLAAIRDKLAWMERSIAVVGDYLQASLGWHFAIADASHNVLLSALMRSRSHDVVTAADHRRYEETTAREASVAAHQELTEVIASRDPERAYALMAEHVRVGDGPLLTELAAEVGRT